MLTLVTESSADRQSWTSGVWSLSNKCIQYVNSTVKKCYSTFYKEKIASLTINCQLIVFITMDAEGPGKRNIIFHPIISSIQKIALYETKSVSIILEQYKYGWGYAFCMHIFIKFIILFNNLIKALLFDRIEQHVDTISST